MATSLSFDKCAACGENNNTQAQTCRKCTAPLPWSKAKKAEAAGKALPPGGKVPKMKVVGPKTSIVASESVMRWAWGLFVFFLCLCLTPAGAFMVHRYFRATESELEGFAEAGLYLCVALWALAFVDIMGKAVQPHGSSLSD